ncbi:DUF4060 family protein [Enterobacter oligotrophicus]|uniref:DUF4060 family protein n=1 Tax=Enterobacter oligotrophicus TaxID=2478464 RepID=UPI0023F04603|nr:DUF4060 family protein [Enterobacter oligotrophicus]ELW1645660.1 DUF4060 family protein [Enterobacter oligotrophicus]
MRLINRSAHDSIGGPACATALKYHFEKYGEHGRSDKQTFYTIKVQGRKITVEVVNRPRSYVATAMTRARHLQCLPNLGR